MPRPIKLVKQSGVATFAAIALTVAMLYFAQAVLIPIALAVLLCFLLAPLTKWLERAKLGRIPSVMIVVTFAFGLILLLGWIVGRQMYALGEDFPKYQDEVSRKAAKIRLVIGKPIQRAGEAVEKVTNSPSPTSNPTTQNAVEGTRGDPTSGIREMGREAGRALTGETSPTTKPLGSVENPIHTLPAAVPISPFLVLSNYLGTAISPLGTAGIVIVFVIFMLLEREDLRDRAISLISRGQYTVTTKALDDAGSRISRYLLAQTIVNGTYGMTIAAGLWAIGKFFGAGVPFPSYALWGLLCALLRFVPYIGPWVAAVFPLALAVAVYPGFAVFGMTLGLFIVIELLSNNLMEPWLYGSSTGLSTLAVLISAVFWTWLWGAVGLLLSTPLTVCIVVLGKHVPHLHFLDVLLGDEPALPPDVSYYQRILAGDKREAAAIAETYAKEKGAEHVPDNVLIPALRLARHDRKFSQLSSEDEAAFYETTAQLIAEWEKKLGETAAKALDSDASKIASPPTAMHVVLGCPSHHRAEELTIQMLSALLKPNGMAVDVVSTRTLPVEIEQMIRERNPSVVFLSILPPGGVIQARYLSRRLRRRFPNVKIVVGYWGRARNFDRLLVQLRSAGASYVTTSLLQSRNQIAGILSANNVAPPPAPIPEPTS